MSKIIVLPTHRQHAGVATSQNPGDHEPVPPPAARRRLRKGDDHVGWLKSVSAEIDAVEASKLSDEIWDDVVELQKFVFNWTFLNFIQ